MSRIAYVTCATQGCGYSPFPVDEGFDNRARKTGERFYCPAGHSLVYNGGKSRDEKRIEELERTIQWREQRINWLERRLLQCDWIWCGFEAADEQGLHTHMRAKHGMPTLAEVRALHEAS